MGLTVITKYPLSWTHRMQRHAAELCQHRGHLAGNQVDVEQAVGVGQQQVQALKPLV
jgi:hypothetical protein